MSKVATNMQRRRSAIVIFTVMVLFFAVWMTWTSVASNAMERGGCDVLEFGEGKKDETIYLFRWKKKEYFAIEIQDDVFPRIASGPPAYIFTTAGRLVDWTKDRGDDNRFASNWRYGPNSGRR